MGLVDVNLLHSLPSGRPLFGDRAHAFRLVASPRVSPARSRPEARMEWRCWSPRRPRRRGGRAGGRGFRASRPRGNRRRQPQTRAAWPRPSGRGEGRNEPPALAQPPAARRRCSVLRDRLSEPGEDDLDEVGLRLQEEHERGDEEADRRPAPERVPLRRPRGCRGPRAGRPPSRRAQGGRCRARPGVPAAPARQLAVRTVEEKLELAEEAREGSGEEAGTDTANAARRPVGIMSAVTAFGVTDVAARARVK